MIDLKALMGDASDRLPGVPGIGEKTALSLVRMYGSIDRLYDTMPDIVIAPETPAKPGMVKKLAAGEESARESYYLATIVTDVPDFSFTPGDNLRQEPKQGLYDLFLRLEFTKLIEKFGLAPAQKKCAEHQAIAAAVEQVRTVDQVERLLALWRGADHVSLLALPDLTGVAVYCAPSEDAAVLAELFLTVMKAIGTRCCRRCFLQTLKKSLTM